MITRTHYVIALGTKAFVDSFLYPGIQCSNCGFTVARTYKTILNGCAISVRAKFKMKIRPKTFYKNEYLDLFKAQILLPSTTEGSGVWENKDQVSSNQNAPIYLWTISPYDIPVQWYH